MNICLYLSPWANFFIADFSKSHSLDWVTKVTEIADAKHFKNVDYVLERLQWIIGTVAPSNFSTLPCKVQESLRNQATFTSLLYILLPCWLVRDLVSNFIILQDVCNVCNILSSFANERANKKARKPRYLVGVWICQGIRIIN